MAIIKRRSDEASQAERVKQPEAWFAEDAGRPRLLSECREVR